MIKKIENRPSETGFPEEFLGLYNTYLKDYTDLQAEEIDILLSAAYRLGYLDGISDTLYISKL